MITPLPLLIERESPVPLYHQLAEQLTCAIDDGRLSPGDPIENEVALAARLRLSRPTVRRAIGELVNRGLLVRRRGVGTRVANRMIHRKAELTSLYDDLSSSGRHPVTTVLSLEIDARDKEAAEALSLPADSPLVALVRLRYADGMPLAVLRNWLPPQWSDLTQAELESDGLYMLMGNRGSRPAVARQRIGARTATAAERRLLEIPRTMPVLTMTRQASDATGTPLEYGNHAYRSDQYALDVAVFNR